MYVNIVELISVDQLNIFYLSFFLSFLWEYYCSIFTKLI